MDGKQVVRDFIDAVWRQGRLEELDHWWTEGCINHAAPDGARKGLDALAAYHRAFAEQMAGFAHADIQVVQQVAEGDRVVTQLRTSARHVASGRDVHLDTMRLDRIEDGRIAEHWSVADLAGLATQLA